MNKFFLFKDIFFNQKNFFLGAKTKMGVTAVRRHVVQVMSGSSLPSSEINTEQDVSSTFEEPKIFQCALYDKVSASVLYLIVKGLERKKGLKIQGIWISKAK